MQNESKYTDCEGFQSKYREMTEFISGCKSEWWTCRDLNSGPLPCQEARFQAAPHAQWTCHLRRPFKESGARCGIANTGTGIGTEEAPEIPEGLLDELRESLDEDSAPLASTFGQTSEARVVTLEESRLGMTGFEHDPNELFRRRRLRVAPGPVTIRTQSYHNETRKCYSTRSCAEPLHAAGL